MARINLLGALVILIGGHEPDTRIMVRHDGAELEAGMDMSVPFAYDNRSVPRSISAGSLSHEPTIRQSFLRP
jgi:hypothetical protein